MMADRLLRNRNLTSADALAVFLVAFLMSSCRGQIDQVQRPPPTPSPAPTSIFADLPPVVATFAPERTNTPVAFVTSTLEPSRTTQPPTPTIFQILIPTTPDNRWEACDDSPLSDLHVGDRAYISYETALPTRIRTQPNLYRSSILGLIIPGEAVEILEGPACADRAVWWKVRSLRKNLQGWVQEGDEEGNWLIQTERDSGAMVPPPTELPCPVNDESFCDFVYGLEPSVTGGEFDEILTKTRLTDCTPSEDADPGSEEATPEGVETSCAYWVFMGRGLGEAMLASTAFIEPRWGTYAPDPRRIAALLLPPYEEVRPALPPIPALFIETGDSLWDWLFFIEKSDGSWQISALGMLSRESDAYSLLIDDPIEWP